MSSSSKSPSNKEPATTAIWAVVNPLSSPSKPTEVKRKPAVKGATLRDKFGNETLPLPDPKTPAMPEEYQGKIPKEKTLPIFTGTKDREDLAELARRGAENGGHTKRQESENGRHTEQDDAWDGETEVEVTSERKA